MVLIIVDKPQEWTSHDVVGKLRRIVGTPPSWSRRNLGPDGNWRIGAEWARQQTCWALSEPLTSPTTRQFAFRIATTTDDAEGELTSAVDAGYLLESGQQQIPEQVARLTGEIMQRPEFSQRDQGEWVSAPTSGSGRVRTWSSPNAR